MAPPFNIILADDHAMFRRGIRRIIESIDDVEVVGEASDGFELLELLEKTSPNLIIMDISMPNLRGLEAARKIKTVNPDIKVLILTMHKGEDYLYQALSKGVEGYLLKEDADDDLLSAIDALRKGGTYISPLLSTQLADLFMQKSQPGTESMTRTKEVLTPREQEIVKLIAEGKSDREVADLLLISIRTVHHHRAKSMGKLNLKKTADLVKYAIQKGYTTPTPG